MTYDESAALMTDMAFRGRVKVACLHFANAILDEASNSLAHNTRYRWAIQTMQAPDMAATQIQPPTVMDAAVQAAGADVDDETLQRSVEAVVQKMI